MSEQEEYTLFINKLYDKALLGLQERGLSEENAREVMDSKDYGHMAIKAYSRYNRAMKKINASPKSNKSRTIKKRRPYTRKPIVYALDTPDPKEKYPEHPDFRPPITTKDVYNAQMAQNMTPVVQNLMKKIAKDRDLQPPDEEAIKIAMKKLDWANLAYEVREMGPKPPPSKIKKFLMEKIFKPIDRLTEKIPLKVLWQVLSFAQVAWMIWATFHYQIDKSSQRAEGVAKKLEHILTKQWDKSFRKKYGLR